MKKLSSVAQNASGQPMFSLLVKAKALEQQGKQIYHFEIGDSDYRAHQHIIEVTKKALDEDNTHYVGSTGILELKQAICNHTLKSLGFRPDIEQVLIMPANAIIDFVIRCVAEKGDEILIPDPGFPTYRAVCDYTGIKAVGYPLKEENRFHPDNYDILEKFSDKTRLLIVNSPHNPTGAVMTKQGIKDVFDLAKDKNIYILSDEVYSRVIYNDFPALKREHYSPAVFDKCLERTIILNGFSKSYSMPGWRLGYAIGPKKLIEKMGRLFQTIFSCTPPFIQYAGISALTKKQEEIEKRVETYQYLRSSIVTKLNLIKGINCLVPEGAYYVFPNIKDTGMNGDEFADFALKEAGVALLPGSCFGKNCNDYVRLCYTKLPTVIDRGIFALNRVLRGRK